MSNRSMLGHVPGMTLMKFSPASPSIAAAVKQELDADMAAFGFEIVNVLVTDIVPDAKVKSAMNDINAAQREQVAAKARGEAEKILVVKKAEAEAESKALQGQGIANQRRAIIEGLRGSIEDFQKARRRRQRQGSHATGARHAIFRHAEIHRRNRTRPTRFSFRTRPERCKSISEQVMQSLAGTQNLKI